MSLIAVSYAMEDDTFRRRISAAVLLYAANQAAPGDPYREHVLLEGQTSMPDPSMVAAVCANTSISQQLAFRDAGGFSADGVDDASITYQVGLSWAEVSAKYGPPPTEPEPEVS